MHEDTCSEPLPITHVDHEYGELDVPNPPFAAEKGRYKTAEGYTISERELFVEKELV